MATLDPPDGPGGCLVAVQERFALMLGTAKPALPTSAALARTAAANRLAGSRTERLASLHDGDHLIAAQELHACFSVQIPASSGLIGGFKLLCRHSDNRVESHSFAGVSWDDLNREVTALVPDPDRGEEVLDQEQAPNELFFGLLGLHLTRGGVATRYAAATVLAVAHAVSHRAKRAAAVPRPDHKDWSNPQQPLMTRTPLNGSLPGGHALVYTALAGLLSVVSRLSPVPANPTVLHALADRLAENREKALVHTPTDTRVGKDAGQWLAGQLIDLADPKGPCPRWAALFALAHSEW